jgi:aconitate hydratase
MSAYLKATEREEVARLADKVRDCLRPDPEVYADPSVYYDQLIEINLMNWNLM